MAFKQPKLKYNEDAFEPYLSKHAVSIHYNKHTAKYFDTLNKLIKGTVFEKKDKLEDLLTKDALVKADTTLFNNACQAWNHSFFWSCLAPVDKVGEPSETLLNAINADFGSVEQLKKKVNEAGMGMFGSGWVWIVIRDNQLTVKTTPNGGNPLSTDRTTPLMCIDLWEHAYCYQPEYEANRQAYLEAMWNIISWDTVSERYAAITR